MYRKTQKACSDYILFQCFEQAERQVYRIHLKHGDLSLCNLHIALFVSLINLPRVVSVAFSTLAGANARSFEPMKIQDGSSNRSHINWPACVGRGTELS